MASPPPSPSSVANSQNSTSKTSLLPKAEPKPEPQVDGAAGNGMLDFLEKKPVVDNGGLSDVLEVKPKLQESSRDIDNPETINKFKKYEADYIRLLMGKYFSKKDPYGANIYSQKLMVEDETIRSSRFPATRSYADPVQGFEDQSGNASPAAETPTGISNGKQQAPKKSG